ncbi:hypothetical protein H109_07082 [Trichophyton interdigitale MR816]|uniref:Uncharacterized protein n=1 Tax=Trichophyton interdigitale (strain MR816) TaxID=1215338 RepID=A0A059IZA2_TRIIM|nr:hypothetical protein H101_01034 [Trichophyton interdigitale H6]KDB20956.1 hypothetical protein H109_07082 [Trichophyton interdigitale MR816]
MSGRKIGRLPDVTAAKYITKRNPAIHCHLLRDTPAFSNLQHFSFNGAHNVAHIQALEGTKKPTNGCGSIGLMQGSLQTTIVSTRDSAGGWSDECPVESYIREVEECNYVDGTSHHNRVWAFGRAVKHMAVLHVAAGDLTLLLE